jgi:Zn-dependent protease
LSSFASNLSHTCPRCGVALATGELECGHCKTLLHADQVEQYAAHARAQEAHGDLQQAREYWLACLPLLPAQSQHAGWIRQHVQELDSAIHSGPHAQQGPPTKNRWIEKLGPLGPILLAVWKLKPLLSFVAFFGFYWQIWGMKFGLGIALLVLFHEMGHFIDIKRRGLPADMPMFLPGLGAYVRWNAMGVPLETRAAISLAGPLAGFFTAAICAGLWFYTHYGLWAALARTGAWFNALNLIPLWIFDGSKGILPLSRIERVVVLLVSAALGYALNEWVFGLVALGAAVRLFTRDAPSEPNNSIAAYFVAVIAGLAIVLWRIPGHLLGR